MESEQHGRSGASSAVERPNGQSTDESTARTVARTAPKPQRRRATSGSSSRKRRSANQSATKPAGDVTATKRRRRTQRTFPAASFEEALTLATAVYQFAGQRVRRLTLFGDHLNKSPDSGPSRQLITNASRYKLINGNYSSEYLELTTDGLIAASSEVDPKDRLRARFRLAIENIPPFKELYERFGGSKLPGQAVLRDHLTEYGYNEVAEAVDTFIVNAKFLGLLRTMAGSERLITLDHALDDTPASPQPADSAVRGTVSVTTVVADNTASVDWSRICFYISPIGAPDSIERKHSDLFLSYIVEPALAELGLQVVRADHITKPGLINTQVIDYLLHAKLVVADLSYHNPNVFYELCIRHMCRLPTVQIIQQGEKLPFDVDQFRTIYIDNSDIYAMIPQLETYKSQVASQARQVLSDPDAVDNPISVFAPYVKVTVAHAS